ncbi:MAG: hypothetical protein AMXMBFR61_10470 [Fimbriimonadales bacterium]
MKHRTGFTLIELLVVIAIIAILAAILFPVFAQARNAAKKTACISNGKQLMVAHRMYSDEFQGTLMGGRTHGLPPNWATEIMWPRFLLPYMKSKEAYLCPAEPKTHYADLGDADRYNNRGWLSIGYNASVSIWYWTNDNSLVRIKQNQVRVPAMTAMFADTMSGDVQEGYYGYCADNTGINITGGCNLSDRHGGARTAANPYGQINVLLLDGHVKSYSWNQIKAGQVSDMYPGCNAEEARDFNAAGLKWMLWGKCKHPDN